MDRPYFSASSTTTRIACGPSTEGISSFQREPSTKRLALSGNPSESALVTPCFDSSEIPRAIGPLLSLVDFHVDIATPLGFFWNFKKRRLGSGESRVQSSVDDPIRSVNERGVIGE